MLETSLGRVHDLFGSQGAAGMAAHAIRHDCQCHAALPLMLQYRYPVLLFLAISLVLCCARIECYGQCFSLSAGRLARKA